MGTQFQILIIVALALSSNAIKFSTNSICLSKYSGSAESHNKLKCEADSHVIYITLVQYTNDFLNECNSQFVDSLSNNTRCVAYPTQSLADFCNGKNECVVKLDQPEFKFGVMGANCDFAAKILTINYECIPSNLPIASLFNYHRF
jgi:hypothetical protein